MHQSSETGYATLSDARSAGLSGNIDYGSDAQAAFQKHAAYLPVLSKLCEDVQFLHKV